MNLVKHFKIFDAGNPREQRGAFFEKKRRKKMKHQYYEYEKKIT